MHKFVIRMKNAIPFDGSIHHIFGPFETIAAAVAWGDANLPDDDAEGVIEPFFIPVTCEVSKLKN